MTSRGPTAAKGRLDRRSFLGEVGSLEVSFGEVRPSEACPGEVHSNEVGSGRDLVFINLHASEHIGPTSRANRSLYVGQQG